MLILSIHKRFHQTKVIATVTPKTEGDGERKGGRERDMRKTGERRREMDRGNKDSSKGILIGMLSF